MDHFPVLVAKYLKLYVARMLKEFFRVNVRRAEGLLCLAASRLVRGQEFVLAAHDPHASPPTACRGLDNQRIPDPFSFFRELLSPFNDAVAPGNGGKTGGFHFPPRTVLLTHHFDDFRTRADEGDFRCFADLGEVGVFGEESVSRVDGIYIRDFGGADYLGDVQITLAAPRRPDADCLVRKPDVKRVTVRFGIDRNRRYAQFLAGADNPQGDLPAIGN